MYSLTGISGSLSAFVSSFGRILLPIVFIYVGWVSSLFPNTPIVLTCCVLSTLFIDKYPSCITMGDSERNSSTLSKSIADNSTVFSVIDIAKSGLARACLIK